MLAVPPLQHTLRLGLGIQSEFRESCLSKGWYTAAKGELAKAVFPGSNVSACACGFQQDATIFRQMLELQAGYVHQVCR